MYNLPYMYNIPYKIYVQYSFIRIYMFEYVYLYVQYCFEGPASTCPCRRAPRPCSSGSPGAPSPAHASY